LGGGEAIFVGYVGRLAAEKGVNLVMPVPDVDVEALAGAFVNMAGDVARTDELVRGRVRNERRYTWFAPAHTLVAFRREARRA
jgi:hypothetical protein